MALSGAGWTEKSTRAAKSASVASSCADQSRTYPGSFANTWLLPSCRMVTGTPSLACRESQWSPFFATESTWTLCVLK